MRKTAKEWPLRLEPVPESEWPRRRCEVTQYPIGVWRSCLYLVQVFEEPPFMPGLGGIELRRMTVNRVTISANGGWEQDIHWEELQRCKRETGHEDWYGIEIYPRDRDLVNVANMRHLWLLREPLAIGWFS